MRVRTWGGVFAAIAVAVGGCGTTTTSESSGLACSDTPDKAVKPAKRLVSCLAPSVALIEYDGSPVGSGLIVASGSKKYILTNLHVVDPDPWANVVLTGKRVKHFDKVPVVGIDQETDVAVLGPITTDRPAVQLVAPKVEKGDDVFLVGYPAETEEEAETTITRGIVSRVREDSVFGFTYVQSDAKIAGGQSGGALANAKGQVVGLSGQSFEDFALALGGTNVAEAVQQILDKKGDDYQTFPSASKKGYVTSGALRLTDRTDSIYLYYDTDEAETVTLEATPPNEIALSVSDYDTGENLFTDRAVVPMALEMMGSNLSIEEATKQMEDESGLVFGDPVAPGKYEIELEANSRYVFNLGTLAEEGVDLTWATSKAMSFVADDEVDVALKVDDQHRSVLSSGERSATFLVDLEGDVEYRVRVNSTSGDPGVVITGPDQGYNDGWSEDDSDVGIGGADVDAVFTPEASGQHRVYVENYGGYAFGYELSIVKNEGKNAKKSDRSSSKKSSKNSD